MATIVDHNWRMHSTKLKLGSSWIFTDLHWFICCAIFPSHRRWSSLPGCVPGQHGRTAALLPSRKRGQDRQGGAPQLPTELLLPWADGAGWGGHRARAAGRVRPEVPSKCEASMGDEFRRQRGPLCRTVYWWHHQGELLLLLLLPSF